MRVWAYFPWAAVLFLAGCFAGDDFEAAAPPPSNSCAFTLECEPEMEEVRICSSTSECVPPLDTSLGTQPALPPATIAGDVDFRDSTPVLAHYGLSAGYRERVRIDQLAEQSHNAHHPLKM